MSAVEAVEVAPQEPPPPGAGGARFVGETPAFWNILVRGAVRLLFTLGIYRFWLATDVRRFLWANTEIAGDGLEYTGTARELLIGFLIAIVLLVPVNLAFFVAALDLGVLGSLSGLLAFVLLALLGQFAVYRARRYRLTRTVFRGIRFHQTGSAWRYAIRALLWWAAIIVTLGLAYPFAQASLERYKMYHTHYGDLRAHFDGSGWRLFFRGFFLWFVVMGPLLIGLLIMIGMVDWGAAARILRRGGTDVMARLEGASPGLASALAIGTIAFVWAIVAAAVLYPAFQAVVLRWWASGIRFGPLAVASKLGTGQVYKVYLRFLGYAIVLAVATSLAAGIAAWLFGFAPEQSQTAEIAATALLVGGYVVVALAYSTIYQATIKLGLWRLGFETIELSGIGVLETVSARGEPSSAVGEGLADALQVGGI